MDELDRDALRRGLLVLSGEATELQRRLDLALRALEDSLAGLRGLRNQIYTLGAEVTTVYAAEKKRLTATKPRA